MKKRVTSGAIASLLAAALFTSAAALTPAAPPVSPVTTASAGSTISAAAVAAATSGQGQTCSYVQATTITLQGAAGTYTLDDRGALVASPPKVTAQDCASSTQGKTAAATGATPYRRPSPRSRPATPRLRWSARRRTARTSRSTSRRSIITTVRADGTSTVLPTRSTGPSGSRSSSAA